MTRSTGGAVAGGSRDTVEAGIFALQQGGNAVDAAVAASLMGCVAEGLLTGLGGGGVALVRVGGEVFTWDFFSSMPGLDLAHEAAAGPDPEADPGAWVPDFDRYPMARVELCYGPTTQVFQGGPASVAPPGMPHGLWELHRRHGRLPFARVAEPAIRGAREGIRIGPGIEKAGDLLWPLLRTQPDTAALYCREDGPLREGDPFRNPVLARTLERFVEEGPDLFRTGEAAQAMLARLGRFSLLGPRDLLANTPRRAEALEIPYRDARVWAPGAPSVGGCMLGCSLAWLNARDPAADRLGPAAIEAVATAMEAAEEQLTPALLRELVDPRRAHRFVSSCQAGLTTHLSVVDEHDNFVGVTSSLGETSGILVPETGVLLNNFLGEDDVNPPNARRAAGQRMVTMTCPTLLEAGDRRVMMGSGGSSRIRSALLHGVLYQVDHRLPVPEAVIAPRCHFEAGSLKVETMDRPPGTLEALRERFPHLVRFDERRMYFGGLHVAGRAGGAFIGAGDTRRGGIYRAWTDT